MKVLNFVACFPLRNSSCFLQSYKLDEMRRKNTIFFLLTPSISVAYAGEAQATCGGFVS